MLGESNSTNSGGAAEEIVNIVRYPNRRLYDRSQARYVTLQEIATMVREGKTVNVRDSKSNDDLTSTILTQIILEQYPERMDILPVPVLHLMIRTNDIVLGLLRGYFRQSVQYLDFWQQTARFNPMATSMEWLNSLLPSTPAGTGKPAASAPPPSHDAALAKRIAEVERRVGALEPSTDASDRQSPSESLEQVKPERSPRSRSKRRGRRS